MIDLNGKALLVTGGTGSFGQRFVSTVLARFKPRRLVVFSRDELKQYEMAQQFSQSEFPCLRYFIGDVRDESRLARAMHGVEYVVHAAAMKHVTAAEYNPFECIRTNVMGAENVVNAAMRAGVRRVIALSTDKAVNPINLYGASKLASDKIFVAANNLSGADGTRYSVVRYGNVLGSRGSVIPYFRKLLADGTDHLPITDPRMTRFWITLGEGVDFVLSHLDDMLGGEVFVPKVRSMKITDLAQAMAPDLPLKVVGIRPGEKLHEMLISRDDARLTWESQDSYLIEPMLNHFTREAFADSRFKRVAEDFEFSSDANADWLGIAELRSILENSKL
ncbi:UDP-N-acetylglucosamine 4,6-dehydratase (inverting) [Ferrovibrio sp.]|uniref:UDP-N-acetylglucosamine 4,6-dehydratase (inverting) n=1 Tax=Ferrovibrio sp. TaxID=1917215 RepID=UPI0025C60619|nr:UDP-N-acetylglucosamine 4,6-dehydratase (inverting) [Ferrovibrio sp.]MBX3456298.1 UDP-N-acetylglucosamine 4,6-dehydratase (inverting) [Ferrovibrio sp.]